MFKDKGTTTVDSCSNELQGVVHFLMKNMMQKKNPKTERVHKKVFRCVHASLKEGLSVRPSVRPSVTRFFSNARKRVFSTSQGGGRGERVMWGRGWRWRGVGEGVDARAGRI